MIFIDLPSFLCSSIMSHAVLSGKEYQTIRTLTQPLQQTSTEIADAKATRRALSKTHTQNWPMNARQKKELEKTRRLAQMEEAQLRLDEREHHFREQEKRETIARANRLMYQENDRVKAFRSSMILSNAMQEREAQEAFRQQLAQQRAEYEKQQEEQIAKRMQAILEKEKEEEEIRRSRAADVSRVRAMQINEKLNKYVAERQEEIIEAAYIRQQAIEAERLALEAEKLRKENERQHAEEQVRANQEQIKLKKELQKIDVMEEELIRRHAAEKDRVASIRKEIDEKRKKERQAAIDAMIEKQYSLLVKVKEEEAKKYEREVAAMNVKAAEKEKLLMDHRAKLQEDLLQGRALQMERLARDKLLKEEEERLMLEEWNAAQIEAKKKEEKEEMEEKMKALALQSTLKSQINTRTEQEKKQRLEKTQLAERMKKQVAYDNQIFDKYTQHYISKFASEGKDTRPMELTVKRLQQQR